MRFKGIFFCKAVIRGKKKADKRNKNKWNKGNNTNNCENLILKLQKKKFIKG
jgi:hypothetical protein